MTAGQIVVGTAGHIDHGKSRLVWTLTGVNPDRLPEEQARGMTIDLGFAHAAIDGTDVWFVDVPGHERFLRNMVAGATGIDLAMLVVAADDSVMPQTREHAEVLSLLGVRRCLIALTKLDLVDDEWAAAVEEESRQLLTSLGIEAVACVWTSAETQRGIPELRTMLATLARQREAATAGGAEWFRLPIDRAFNVAGRGVVVTGSVAHGRVAPDDDLTLWPAGKRVRVRGLQSHSESRAAAAGRMRLAVNLAGVGLDDVRRGFELASPGYLEAARCIEAYLPLLRMPGRAVKKVIRLRLHAGTSETLAKLRLPEDPPTETLRGAFAQIVTAEPLVVEHGQHFILRDETGTRTLGGGRVLRPVARLWTSRHAPHLDGLRALHEGTPRARVEETIRDAGWQPPDDAALAARAGCSGAAEAAALVRQLGVEGRLIPLTGDPAGDSAPRVGSATSSRATDRTALHAGLIQSVASVLVERLTRHLAANPRLPGLPLAEWRGWMPRACPARLRPALAAWLVDKGHVVLADGFVVPRGHAAAISEADRLLLDEIVRTYEAAGFQPPTLDVLPGATPRNARHIRELIDLACVRGRLVRIADGLWLGAATWQAGARKIVEALRTRGGLTVADLRDLLGSTRKFVVPLAEYCDSISLTRRQGDLRVVGARADELLARWEG
ncbi:MAG: selenocysteine-specific translation elongation factor [Phycisphaerales bacterium]|nr:selenocysteine-specific translation elongation factor [Phycisphaerales bacterium]